MSTRAVYGFKDEFGTHHVYVHHDGYPSGAAEKFQATLDSKNAWPLPRFEANEFGAAFIACNKKDQGSVRLTHGPQDHGDTEYYYVVCQPKPGGPLHIAAYQGQDTTGKLMFKGLLTKFIQTAEKIEQSA